MEGVDKEGLIGVIPRTFKHIFNYINNKTSNTYLVWISMLELYNENIIDSLDKKLNSNLEIREN